MLAVDSTRPELRNGATWPISSVDSPLHLGQLIQTTAYFRRPKRVSQRLQLSVSNYH